MTKLGLIHIYTGDGKGKTTAAVGLAVRALGSGFNVCYCSFHKRPEKYGYAEMESLKKLGATVLNFAKGHPHLNKSIDEKQIKREVSEAIQTIQELLASEHYDILILDEILISVRDHYLDESLLIDLIKNKPVDTELVLTGRAATENVMELADYVTFCKKLKHPYDRKIQSRKGIEY
jgi:cob(I)alamin adenosyltransferase